MPLRRTRLEVMIDILDAVKVPVKPTYLMYKTNMSWKSLTMFVNNLVAKVYVKLL